MTGPAEERTSPAGNEPAGGALFPTAIGTCGVAWRGEVLIGVQLPEADDATTVRRLKAKAGRYRATTPPAEVERAIEAMTGLLAGRPVDLRRVAIDLDAVGDFERSVYEITRAIGPGSAMTYGEVATALGQPGAARAVGRALGDNPWPIVVPCHRVLGAGGKLTGFSANGGVTTKRRMLLIEGCPAIAPSLFD